MPHMSETPIFITFSKLPDPRKPRNQLYTLADIVCTSILATICSCSDYEEISDWTEGQLDWLQSLGLCLKGAPSHDTYERFFRYLDSNRFEECFLEWTQQLCGYLGKSIAIDGKTLCGSRDGNTQPLHLVSAFATEHSLVVGQLKATGKGGELAAIQKLLNLLDIKGSVITIDAAGCQKVVVEAIIEKKGDYLLCAKGNQGTLHAELDNFFKQAIQVSSDESGCEYFSTEERVKGHIEKREVWTSSDIEWLPQRTAWVGLCSIVAVKRTVITKDSEKAEVRYFISSMSADAEHQGEIIRKHWGVENKLHWQLDVTYREDMSRVRKGNGAENLSVLRRLTMNILRNDKKSKKSLKKRRLIACWNRDYMLELLGVK